LVLHLLNWLKALQSMVVFCANERDNMNLRTHAGRQEV
jgi:hypothetical protein